MRYAVVNASQVVSNVVLADSPSLTGAGPSDTVYELTDADVVGPGYTRSGNTWVEPAPDPRQVNRATIVDRSATALTNNDTFLAIASPNNTQTVNQVKALTRQVNGVIRLLLDRLDSTTGT